MVTRTKSHNIDAENALQATRDGARCYRWNYMTTQQWALTQITCNASQ